MYAVVRRNTYDPEKLASGAAEMREFEALHAAEPGYIGNIVVDAGNSQHVLVTLWRSEEEAKAAIPRLVPHIQRLVEPLLAAPSELIGTGDVVVNDLVEEG